MLRLSLANCPQFNFFPTTQKGDKLTGILIKPQHRIQRSQQVKGKIELYQEIDPTRNTILINIINDVVAGWFATMEQKRDLGMNSVTEKYKTRISSR